MSLSSSAGVNKKLLFVFLYTKSRSKRFVVSSIATKKVGAQHNVTFSEKRSFHRRAPHEEDRGDESGQRQEGSAHLVPPVHHSPGLRRPHHRRSQWPQVHPGLRDREHGWSQA